MQKIMFNDKFHLTQAVLDESKTQTRRIIKMPKKIDGRTVCGYEICCPLINKENKYIMPTDEEGYQFENELKPKYQVGEIVAVAQSYKDCGEFDVYEAPKGTAGWSNKMFVRADLMPHQIQITDIRFEKLQDISEDDCIADIPQCDKLIQEHYNACISYGAKIRNNLLKRRDIFAVLIDKINGKGTWESNPYVVVYEFTLIK
jgi:hypothetical protein